MITDVDIRQHMWYIEIKVDVRRQMEALMKHITLSDGEWKIMKLLWNTCPLSLREITNSLEKETDWSRPTVHVMLKRLMDKGAVGLDKSGKIQKYYPIVEYREIAPRETESFLNRVYDGSVGMLFTALTERKKLSEKDIEELRRILDEAEKKKGK